MARITPRLLLGFVASGLLALGAIVTLPGSGGNTPPAGTLIAVALAVSLVTGIALFAGIRFELGLPASIALFAVGYNILVVVVKFVLGPQALYDASEAGKVTSDLGDQTMATLTALGISAVYLFAFWLLYRLARRQLVDKPAERSLRWVVVVLVVGVLFVSGLLPVLLLVFAFVGGEYVSFVFGSAASLVAGAALALALSLALLTLTSTAERARAVGDATLLASVFWVGAAYLALYHALWVVYILVLTSIWAAQGRHLEVTRLVVLFARMLRYRVAAMIWLFLLLGAAYPSGLDAVSPALALSTLALAAGYVAATSVNDLADEAIDRVNHPRDSGRPLISGDADRRDLHRLHLAAWALALAAAAPLGMRALGLVTASLLIGVAYSVRPLSLSYRTWLAPLVLSLAYVAIPYALGATATGRRWGAGDAVLLPALVCLFLARIVLKDFRDRAGDRLYGRPTLLLRFGKTVTCAISAACLAAGATLAIVAMGEPALVSFVVGFAVAIAWMLHRLWRAPAGRNEQVAIGLGARVGNGLLIGMLLWLVLEGEGAPIEQKLLAAALVAAGFGAGFVALARRPHTVVLGYKG